MSVDSSSSALFFMAGINFLYAGIIFDGKKVNLDVWAAMSANCVGFEHAA